VSATPGPRPFALEPEAGVRLVGDLLPGRSPGYLFLHGLGSVRQGEKSTSLMAHAAAVGRSCLRFDFRGHGESSGEFGHATASELLADTLFVLERHGPCIVVGSSLGGLIGAHAAAARPDLVPALALLAPALGFLARLESRVDAAGLLWTTEGRSFRLTERVLQDARRFDERALPRRLSVPTFVVHGTADEVVPHALSERFHAELASPRKRLWIVPGGNHRLNLVAAEAWRRLDAFLAGAGE
jgi:pimeloyl-ACP methyl ester carboxylesterase